MQGTTFFFNWEIVLMEWLQKSMGGAMTWVVSFFTLFGEEAVAIGILGFLYWVWDKDAAVYAGTNVLVGTVCNPFLKNFALRRRPYFDHPSITCFKPVHAGDIHDIALQGYSFPSGHSSNSVILYGSLALVHRFVPLPSVGKKRKNRRVEKGILYTKPQVFAVIAVAVPLLVGLSRVMLGVHYPTDVLAGWLSGAAVTALLSAAQRAAGRKEILYAVLALVFAPGFFICRTNDFYTCYGILCGFFLSRVLDEHLIRFQPTRNVRAAVLRMAAGLALYYGLNLLLKLPFPDEFLHSATTGQFLFRALRYFLVSFLMLGVYPASFKRIRLLS